jgi:hypothetical protein
MDMKNVLHIPDGLADRIASAASTGNRTELNCAFAELTPEQQHGLTREIAFRSAR